MSSNSTESDVKVKAMYRGPGVHERVLSRSDLLEAEVCEDEDLPENFQELRWGSQPGRRWVKLDGLPEEVIDLLKEDPSFEVKEGGEVVSQADPEAAHVNAAGGSPGIPENPELAEAIGWEPPETDPLEESQSSGEFEASSAGNGGEPTTTGSSTA